MAFYAVSPAKGYDLQTDPEIDPLMQIAQPLPIKEKLQDFDERVPHYQLCVIQHNSTFIEMVDRNYAVRGIATVLGLVASYIGIDSFIFDLFISKQPETVFDMIMTSLFLLAGFFILRFECFRYTHYPVRLNRKNRQVYVWRKNGSVWKIGWDDLFFFIRRTKDTGGGKDYDVVAALLQPDGKTVIESFVFGDHDARLEAERAHFGYFRRFMEVGPEQTYRMLKVCLPLAKRRESLYESYMRSTLNSSNGGIIGQLLMCWWNIPIGLARWIAMLTCRVPRWPDWVEKECAIEPNDPYVRESGYVAPRE